MNPSKTHSPKINMGAIDKVVKDMANYRAELTRDAIIMITKDCLAANDSPDLWPETVQDVWFSYCHYVNEAKGYEPN